MGRLFDAICNGNIDKDIKEYLLEIELYKEKED